MKTTSATTLALSLIAVSQLLGTSAGFEWEPVRTVPSAGRGAQNTFGPAVRTREAGLPDHDTSIGNQGYTRTSRDWDTDYRGLDRGTRSNGPQNSSFTGLSGLVIDFGEAMENIQRVVENDATRSSGEVGPTDFGNEPTAPPFDDPMDDTPIGQDDFEVEGFDYRPSTEFGLLPPNVGQYGNWNAGTANNMPSNRRRHVPPVVTRRSTGQPFGEQPRVGYSMDSAPPAPPRYDESVFGDLPVAPAPPVDYSPEKTRSAYNSAQSSEDGYLPVDYGAWNTGGYSPIP